MNNLWGYNNKVNLAGVSVPMRIDIACGAFLKKGYIGIDKLDHGQNIVWDVTTGLPLGDSTCNDIYTSHFMEHLFGRELEYFLLEVIRVATNGAKLTVIVPHGDTLEGHFLCHFNRLTEQHFRGWVAGLEGHLSIVEIYRATDNSMDASKKNPNGMHLIGEFIINK
jgi:hypothetical protein